MQKFSFEHFLNEIEAGNILVDFDARTGQQPRYEVPAATKLFTSVV